MIVITAPTGQIGSQLTRRLLGAGEPVRVVVRDPSRLASGVAERAEVVTGSHADPATLDRALAGADALFWLVPPAFDGDDAEDHYGGFTRPAAEAIGRHEVAHVVGVSTIGHDWPQPAGLLSAAVAMDREIESTGVAYRALSMPFYMENLLAQVEAITGEGVVRLAYAAERPLASVATRDIATVAAELLSDRAWGGQEHPAVLGPDALTPPEMVAVIAEVVGREVSYEQVPVETFESFIQSRGATPAWARDMRLMIEAQNAGVYDAAQASTEPTATDFRTWCEAVLRPAATGEVSPDRA